MKTLITVLFVAATVVGCVSTANVKPLAPGAIACHSDWDCPDNMHCGFPGVDTYAQCLNGGGEDRWGPSGAQQ